MAQFEPHASTVNSKGSLVYVAAQRRGGVIANPEAHFEHARISFPFLLDEDRSVTKAYGVYVRLNLESVNIARPATFVIARDGTIAWMYVGGNQTDRRPVEEVLRWLEQTS